MFAGHEKCAISSNYYYYLEKPQIENSIVNGQKLGVKIKKTVSCCVCGWATGHPGHGALNPGYCDTLPHQDGQGRGLSEGW